MNVIYGIPNCSTMKKARHWLNERAIDYSFHNYKKQGIDTETLTQWCVAVGWEILLNKRGTTWRKLAAEDKADMNEKKAIALMVQSPSMIKRPVLVMPNHIEVGFSDATYQTLFEET